MAQHLQAEVGYLQDTTGNVEQHRPHLKAAVECWNSCEQVAEVFFPFLLAGGVLFFIASVFAVSSLVPLCLICCARSETPKIAHLVRHCECCISLHRFGPSVLSETAYPEQKFATGHIASPQLSWHSRSRCTIYSYS